MAQADSVGQQTGAAFSRYLIASANGVSLATAGNAVVALPILGGGLTNGGGAANSGGVIVRQVTIQNPSAAVNTANIAILTTSDGNTSNAVVSSILLGNLTATGKFQDLSVASPYNLTTSVTGNTTQAFYVYISATGSGTVDVRMYGDVVNF
jgi:hypothetical protein